MNISKIEFSQKQIDQFKKMGVETVYLFGSQAQGFTHPLSDVDVGVVFEEPEKYKNKTAFSNRGHSILQSNILQSILINQ